MKKNPLPTLSLHSLLTLPDPVTSPDELFTLLPALETPRLLLRKARLRDANDIFAYSSDEDVARYVLWDAFQKKSEARSFIRYLHHQYRHGQPSSWVIELKQSHQVIGVIGLMWYSEQNSSAEVGYSLGKAWWNQGYATEALSRVLNFCFQRLKLNRVEAQHDIRNPSSGRVMVKCGMVKEGVLRRRIFNKGEYADVALYAILADDPRPSV